MDHHLSQKPTDKKRLWAHRDWRAVAAAFMLCGLLFGVWASRIPAFKGRFDLEPGVLGVLLLAFALGAISSFPFAGALSERIGPTRLTLVCAVGYCPALVALSLAPSVLTLGCILVVFGIFHGAMDVAMNGWAARVENRLKRSTMSIFHAGFSLGAGLGAASGFLAAHLGLGPGIHFATVAVVGGLVAPLFMVSGASTTEAPTNGEQSGGFFVFPSRALLPVGLIAFAVSMGEGAMVDWSAVFLVIATDATETTAALGYAAFSAMMVLARLFGGMVVDKLGPIITTQMSATFAFIGLVLAMISSTAPMAIFGFALIGIGYAIVMPLAFSRAASDPAQAPGPAIASVAVLA